MASAQKRSLSIPPWLDRLFYFVGIALLVYVISRYPLVDLLHACARLGPTVALTPLIAMTWFCLNTTAFYFWLDGGVTWIRLLRIRLIGDAYNALLPLAGLGGEPFKLRQLSRYIPTDRLVAALIRDRVVENAVGLLYISLWLGLGMRRFHLPAGFRVALYLFVPLAALFGFLSGLLVVTNLPTRAGATLARWLGVPTSTHGRVAPSKLAAIVLCCLLARVAGTAETALLFWLLGFGFDPLMILFSYSLLNGAGYIGFAIPQGLGVFEGTTVFLFSVLGLPGPAGVALALARRGRMLVVGLFGVLLHVVTPSLAPDRAGEQEEAGEKTPSK